MTAGQVVKRLLGAKAIPQAFTVYEYMPAAVFFVLDMKSADAAVVGVMVGVAHGLPLCGFGCVVTPFWHGGVFL